MSSSPASLEELLAQQENIVEWFRDLDMPSRTIWTQPDEYTNWIEEQRSWREGCAFRNMSYHMNNLYIEGPDAIDLFSDLGVNSFENFRTQEPPQAKQLVCCNPDGYVISDGALYYLDEDEYVTTSTAMLQHWLEYHIETGEYDVSIEVGNNPGSADDPREFRFQVQGPNAKAVMDDVIDGGVPEISLFEIKELTIDDRELYALGHGMAGSFGVEIAGPYDYHDEIRDRILEVGKDRGIRQLGTKSYKTTTTEIGWFGTLLPAIYDNEELEEYREWLDIHSPEGYLPIGGSYHSDDITDYYLDPVEMGYEHLIDFDHDFVGKESLREIVDNPRRKRVTLIWDDQDVIDVYASLFHEGETSKFIDIPDTYYQWDYNHNDKVLKDGEIVGISKVPSYNYNERTMLSLAVIDRKFAEPETELTMVWGDQKSSNSSIERHTETEITATVAPSPLHKDRN
ncbi:hypothetical protein [Halobellus salinisoli]|uniref:hypothetical protein n=1 Tax=Halobellus salinisoli TaxID=3108500 RepID=UPI00300BB0B2